MYLSSIPKFVATHLVWFVGGVLVGALVGVALTYVLPNNFTTAVMITTNDSAKADHAQILTASHEPFADTVQAWMTSPDVASKMLQHAGVAKADDFSLNDYARFFTAKKVSAHAVEVRYTTDEQTTAAAIPAKGMEPVLAAQTKSLNAIAEDTTYAIAISEPVIKQNIQNPVQYGITGAILGLVAVISAFVLVPSARKN